MKRSLRLPGALITAISVALSAPAIACEATVPTDPSAVFSGFSERWSSKAYPPIPVRPDEVAAAEKAFGFLYPATYREAVLLTGLPRPTADLWDAIGDESDLPHLNDFLSPSEAYEHAVSWRLNGYPDDLVPFATDSGGNLLSFRKGDASDRVWLWDHDFGDTDLVASSFTGLIEAYCALLEPPL